MYALSNSPIKLLLAAWNNLPCPHPLYNSYNYSPTLKSRARFSKAISNVEMPKLKISDSEFEIPIVEVGTREYLLQWKFETIDYASPGVPIWTPPVSNWTRNLA